MASTPLPGQPNIETRPAVFSVAFGFLCAHAGVNLLLQPARALPLALVFTALFAGLLFALWSRKAWAHFIVMVLVALGAAYNIIFLLTADFSRIKSAPPEAQAVVGVIVVQMLVNFWLFYALNRRDVRLWCHRKV